MTAGHERGLARASIDRFITQLKKRATPGLAWKFSSYDRERHDTISHPSLYDGLNFVFAGWDIVDRPTSIKPSTYSEAVSQYRRLSKKYGFTIPPPLSCLTMIAWENAYFERWDEALMVSHEAIKQFPEFSSAYEEIADIYERKGDKEPAIKNYQTALKLDPKSDVAKKGLDRLSPSTKQP